MSSILDSVKLYLGIPPEHVSFNDTITMQINSAFSVLSQIGACSSFTVTDSTDDWSDVTSDATLLSYIKQFVYKRTQLSFDPPQSSFVLSSVKSEIDELTWRINVLVDPSDSEDKEEGAEDDSD